MRTNCAALISAVILGAPCFSCSNNAEIGAGNASDTGDSGIGQPDSKQLHLEMESAEACDLG
jgi:hypothetical protein